MRTRSSSNLVGESSPNPTSSNTKRCNRRRSKQPFILEESPIDTMDDQRTMAELLRAPTEGYAEAIVVPPIPAEHFELKHSLINMMTSDQFFGLEKDNPHDHIHWFNKITSTIKYKDVPNSANKLMLFPFSLAGAARRWLKKEPPHSILTWEDLVSKFINEFFPPSRTTNLRNEVFNFQQRFDESFHEAWDRYKDLLRACPHHGFTELHLVDTFYNTLNPADQDSLNFAAGGNLLERRTQDIAKLTHAVNQQTSDVTTAMTVILKQFQATPPPASVKAVEEICVTCGGAHPYYQFLAVDGNTFLKFRDNIQGYVSAAAVNCNQGELKAITTRSGLVLDGSFVPMPPSIINPEEDERVEETLTDPELAEDPRHPNIPYPSRMYKEKQQDNDEIQIHKFWQIFKQLHINITLADALILISKYQKMIKALLSNKEKLLELANTPLNENCSAVILKKLPEKLGDPGKFIIMCGFSELKCKALADLGASINLMPLSVLKKLDLYATNHLSGNPTFSSHTDLTSSEVINPLSGSTTSSSTNHLLEEFADELALITFPPGNDDLPFDIEFDLREIEYLLNHDPTKEMDSILEDSVDEDNLADPNNNLVDTIPEMFTNEHTLDYSSPPLYYDVDDDHVELESDNDDVYEDPFDSKEEKINESKLLINELDLPRSSDFLPSLEYDSVLYEDFSKVDDLPSTNNEDKVFNPGILIHENLSEVTVQVTPDKNVKKISISHASLILEDSNPPLYELPFHKEVLESETLLSFSSENEEKVFKSGILTSKGVHTSLLLELSHRGPKAFKVIKNFESPMEIFP
uniref:Reverse transcriptase domain-containing protein n=1 Tax=Tanacetum cinerariifolium TaxID=118510 RepID=A0A699HGD2_TANCI|nr:reverse transcriptase domain-containing protein [Tanacetum cinerariifolium]